MKNLLNCHCRGLHSFPLSLENNLYKRVFITDKNHDMWKPFEVAIHPHHVDIKITVLVGDIHNPIYKVDTHGSYFNKFQWQSHIKSGTGGFKRLGVQTLSVVSSNWIQAGESVIMQACELHTVQVNRGEEVAWLIEESIPTCEYFPINYSPHDLEKWTPEGLYQEVDDDIKQLYFNHLNIEQRLKEL